MANIGYYCKAYLLSGIREYPGWNESVLNEKSEVAKNGDSVELNDDSIVYLQENFTVTGDVFIDKIILFENISDDWKEFCQTKLEFSIPDYVDQG